MAMSFNEPKPTLNAAIDRIIYNLRSTKQPSIECFPFSKHFNRSPNTFWKSLVLHAINLDKGKSIVSKERAQDWGANDIVEDGYLEETIPDSRGYESDPNDKTDQVIPRAPLSNPFSQGDNCVGRQLTEGKTNRTLKPLAENPGQTQNIR